MIVDMEFEDPDRPTRDLSQVEADFQSHFVFIDSQITQLDDDEIREPLRQIRSEVYELLQEKSQIVDLTESELKLYLCLFTPIALVNTRRVGEIVQATEVLDEDDNENESTPVRRSSLTLTKVKSQQVKTVLIGA